MKFKVLYSIFIITFIAILSLSNSAGRANGSNQGNTGAPGDQAETTCQSCHATGDIQVTMKLEVLDAAENPVSSYTPNEVYTAKVTIDSPSGPSPSGYGFQMVSLFNADDSDVKGWTETGHSDNVQIALANRTERVYAEHKGVGESNEFLVQWQAPEAGSGAISFYAAGNGVNDNGARSGDGATIPQKLTLSEGLVSTIQNLNTVGVDLQIGPNPVKSQLFLTINSEKQQDLLVQILTTAGQILYQENLAIGNKEQISPIDLSSFNTGIYLLQITNRVAITTKKIIKI